MEHLNTSQHPSVELGHLRIPGPAIAVVLVGVPLVVRPRTLRHLLSDPAFRKCLEYTSVVIHLLLYIDNVWKILNEGEPQNNNTLPLLEYTSLVLGEAVLKKSNFWLYTSVAEGWTMILPRWPFSQMLSSPSIKAWISLVLSLPSALRMSGELSRGATLSALSLLTRTTFMVLAGPIAVHKFSAITFAGVLLPILARSCYAIFFHVARGKLWFNRLGRVLQSGLRIVQQNSVGELRTRQCIRYVQMILAVLTLQGVGWILSSFIWSCFRWRWLFSRQASRAPSWTMFSLFGGGFFFLVLALMQKLQVWERTADLNIFMERKLVNCLSAVWWTSCTYLLLWFVCETIDKL